MRNIPPARAVTIDGTRSQYCHITYGVAIKESVSMEASGPPLQRRRKEDDRVCFVLSVKAADWIDGMAFLRCVTKNVFVCM